MIKKLGIVLSLMLIVGGFLYGLQNTNKVHAQTIDKITGYAWSTNVGWVRMNCENNATDNTCGNVQYGVIADHDTGVLSGYAWSSVVGWISFENASGCPSVSYFNSDANNYGDNCYARALFSYGTGGADIVGWARVVAGPSNASCSNGACGEWISLSCLNSATSSNQTGYCSSSNHKVSYPNDNGPSLTNDGGPLSGYAYGSGGTNVGWLDMSDVIWNTSEDTLFCVKYPNHASCKQSIYITATNTPNSGFFDVGTSPGIDLEYGSKNHTAFYDKCTASTTPISTGSGAWTGIKDTLDSNNSWTYTENAVRVPYPNYPSTKVTYTITCPTDATHSISASIDVDVTVPTWTLDITANGSTGSTIISSGGSAIVVWNAVNAPTGTTCSAPIWAPNQTGTNITSSISNITNSTTYAVTCTPPGGSTYAKTASVQVNVVSLTSFNKDASCLAYGTNPVLSWSSQNAATCTVVAPGATISALSPYSSGTTFTQGVGTYTMSCKDVTNTYTSDSKAVNVTACTPTFSMVSSTACSGSINANGGITDNSFQKAAKGTSYVAKIPVDITPTNGFNSDIKYTFQKPATTAWNNVSVNWSGNMSVKYSPNYSDTLIITAPTQSAMDALFAGLNNPYQALTITGQSISGASLPTRTGNYSVCAPGSSGSKKPIFIES